MESELTKLDIEGLRTLIEWAKDEGWNPGIHDDKVFFGTDPNGFYGYLMDGQLIAGGALISYGGQFGYMGLFLVRKDLRGKGIGKKLWFQRRDTLLSRLQENSAIGMDGVVNMQPFYQKGGFQPAFREERYAFRGKGFLKHPEVRIIDAVHYRHILPYDKMCFGFDRSRFMELWISRPQTKTFIFEQNGSLMGFACIRKAVNGYKIGPLFADNVSIAEALLETCLSNDNQQTYYMDIPVTNRLGLDLASRLEGSYIFECARMYYGQAPDLPVNKIFGITSFELG